MTARKHEPETVPLCALLEREGPQVRWADPSLARPEARGGQPVQRPEPATTAISARALGALLERSKPPARSPREDAPPTRALRVREPRARKPSMSASASRLPTVAVARPARPPMHDTEPTLSSLRRTRLRAALITGGTLAAVLVLAGVIVWSEVQRSAPRRRTTASAPAAASSEHAAVAPASPPPAVIIAPPLQLPAPPPTLVTTDAQAAASALAEGRYRDAITHYRGLERAHPEQPAYGVIAAILSRELAERCAHGARRTDPECQP